MIRAAFEGLLPGMRSLRAPIISGFLWVVLAWVLAADSIPPREQSTGWFRQAYGLADAIGPGAALTLASLAVFVVGATLQPASKILAAPVAWVSVSIAEWGNWLAHAGRQSRRIRRNSAERTYEFYLVRAQKVGDTEAEEKAYAKRIKELSAKADEARKSLADLRSVSLWQRLAGGTKAREYLGSPPLGVREGFEHQALINAYSDGFFGMASEMNTRYPIAPRTSASLAKLEPGLVAELAEDPIEVFRLCLPELFHDLSRERAERQVRLAFAGPLLAWAVLIALQVHGLGWLLTALPIALIAEASIADSRERANVLRLLILHSRRSPTLNRAYELGRRDARVIGFHEGEPDK